MKLKIKNIELESNAILAPMAGYTDLAFRKMCADAGAGLTCTEMVSSKALHYKNKKTEDLLLSLEGESPKAVQLFGHEPDVMAEAVQNPLLDKFDIIDINMGCPAKKIVANGDGSALLKDINLARKIIEACVGATKKPVTVKFRIGYRKGENIAVEFAKMCEEAGASAITVHGRTTEAGYSGEVDYETIRAVKQAVKIPVFANGNICSKEDYKKVLEKTGADGVMIGRASVGKPEVFSQILQNNYAEKSTKLEQIKFHYETLMKFYPESQVVKYMRSHLAGYLSGEYKNAKLLVYLLKCDSYTEIITKLGEFIDNLVKI